MEPVTLRTARLVLSVPEPDDVDDIAAYCTDPLFEKYLTTPWPYRREHAEDFVTQFVPSGWRFGSELVWALRERPGGPLLGVVGLHRRRALEPESRDVGYWLGAPHRGRGYMAEAVRAVVDWFQASEPGGLVYWECAVGNVASARTARAAGFRYTGTGPSQVAMRDGSHPPHWHGERRAGSVGEPALPWPDQVHV
ncbi:GNAT family N-acetyltransferase [Gryllotalpicola ginsengisoli]|uniref:GNAT family N-acetyltransferase n=1 Tax=Gryllotalpicola ginsengisoli TaxID=444608 RepID=UPI0003B79C3C|nr:GNAT family N-acetyltransferase [Gryllotalpicola ginsengisoli]